MTVAYLTSGAAGMYCGSCMHDNTLARGLTEIGVDVQLIPTYTPIRTDENDVSIDRVFFGGINIYLQQRMPLFRHLPGFLDRLLDSPWLIRRVAAGAVETSPKDLGALTVSMLRGSHGGQRKEIRKLCSYLKHHHRPKLVVLSNMLIGGCIPAMKSELNVPVLVTLQGDDIFLNDLIEPFKTRAFDEIRQLIPEVDGFIVNSRYYAEFMSGYFAIPADKMHIVPLGIDVDEFPTAVPARQDDTAPTVGYLARLAPEKGLHHLVDAFILLRKMPGMKDAQLRIAGWLGKHRQAYADEQFAKLAAAGLGDAFHYAGSVDRSEKLAFLSSLSVLSVPTTYHEPKGLYVLEALAAGVPVVQPAHGAFPELIEATGGGIITAADDPQALALALHSILTDPPTRCELASRGHTAVHNQFNRLMMAKRMQELYNRFTG